VPDDPGPWSVVSHVRQALAHRPERRHKPTPFGLLIASPPRVPVPIVGLQPGGGPAGAGRIRLVAAAREPALGLHVEPDGASVVGVSPMVRRRWTLPELVAGPEERPGQDPAAALAPPLPPEALAGADLEGAARAPANGLAAVVVAAGRVPAIALLRLPDRALVRWIAGARAAAWSQDGERLVIGGAWGVMLAVPE
jgi:hypothetical protein